MINELLNNLNNNQLKAVTAPLGPVVVVAGAGTGKTTVLTNRIIYIQETFNISSQRILAVTFTNKAANEMKKRITKYGVSVPLFSTYHSFGVRFLKSEISFLGRNPNFTIIDDDDQESLIREIMKAAGVSYKVISPSKAKNLISKIKSEDIDINRVDSITLMKKLGEYNFEVLNPIKYIYKIYCQKLIEQNYIDFDDLLILTLKILDEAPEIADKWKSSFDYILVDEFQDTNKMQFDILKHLINKDNNVFVVGDPDQTIYTWRGAYPMIFDDFYKLTNPITITLDLNYRSTQLILNAANDLIGNNVNRIKKDLVTNKGTGVSAYIYNASDRDDEARYIARKIKSSINDDIKYSDIAVLYRQNSLSRSVENALINNSIPYAIIGGVKFYQRKEIKDLVAYLRLIVNNEDEISLRRVINVPTRGIGATTIDKIDAFAQFSKIPFGKALKDSYDQTPRSWDKFKIVSFLELVNEIKEESKNFSLSQTIQTVIDKTGYLKYLESLDQEWEERKNNIDELLLSASNFENEHEDNSLVSFLQEISLYSSSNDKRSERDEVTLMTIHTAKGSEYKIVFLIGLNEGVFPSIRQYDNDPHKIEEERRTAYVGITRAMEQLYISSPKGYDPIHKSDLYPSRFIKEIGRDNIKIDANTSYSISRDDDSWFDSSETIDYSKNYEEKLEEINEGDQIVHTIFGEGLVLSKNGDFIDVLFKHPHGPKTLMWKHKNIKRKI